jgi:hypothetical protein
MTKETKITASEMGESLIFDALRIIRMQGERTLDAQHYRELSLTMAIMQVETIITYYDVRYQGFLTWQDENYWEEVKNYLQEKAYSTK